MRVLLLVSMRRYLITCLFSNMPGGRSRRHFSQRFGFQPEPRARTRGFQKDAVEKVKLSRNPLHKYWWGSCGELCCVERCYFHLEKAMRKELSSFENPCLWVLGTCEHDAEQWNKCFINIVMGLKPPWRGMSLEWRSLCTSVVYFGGFPVILASSPSPDISRCALPISVLRQDEAVGAVADQ